MRRFWAARNTRNTIGVSQCDAICSSENAAAASLPSKQPGAGQNTCAEVQNETWLGGYSCNATPCKLSAVACTDNHVPGHCVSEDHAGLFETQRGHGRKSTRSTGNAETLHLRTQDLHTSRRPTAYIHRSRHSIRPTRSHREKNNHIEWHSR